MSYLPRLIIAGTHSGVGKTTVALGLMSAFSGAGHKVQPFKVGPDYIDAGYHSTATGLVSRNLDIWMLGVDCVLELFCRSAVNADISIIEGVMGLYDGFGAGDKGSSAQVAKTLRAPVLLVVDARSMSRSAAAVVLGYKIFDPELHFAGVFLNRVGGERHFRLLKEAIESETGLPVLGWLRREDELTIPERHLGLLPAFEKKGLNEYLGRLAAFISRNTDIDKLYRIACQSEPLDRGNLVFPSEKFSIRVRIGVVKDRAFNFYYQDGLELLESLGAELVFCSALEDEKLPGELGGLYIGGGFPEVFLDELACNRGFMADLQNKFEEGMPVYAECGGFMYLAKTVTGLDGRYHEMAGIIPGRCRMKAKRAALGYVWGEALCDNLFFQKGDLVRGHEFHYSVMDLPQDVQKAYTLSKDKSDSGYPDGIAGANLLASYLHLHLAGCPKAASKFVNACVAYRKVIGG